MGIDLGTTNSCVAVWKNGQIAIVPNDCGKRITPSVVSFLRDGVLVGNAASKKLTVNHKNTVFNCKRLLGHKITDEVVKSDLSLLPYVVVADDDNNIKIQIETSEGETKYYSPEEISAMILRYLRSQAEAFVGHVINDVVITVPAYFTEAQRKATTTAARLVGLNVLQLLDEPTATTT